MFHLHPVTRIDLPELAPYRTLKLSHEHRQHGFFVAEGDKVVHRLLASSLEIISVFLPAHRLSEYEPALQARAENILTYVVTEKEVLTQLVGFEMFQGVMAVARIPRELNLFELLQQTPAPRLFVAADGLSNAENVGALVRNCAAFGAQALITGETCASPYLRRAVRNSMGTVFHLPILESPDLVQTMHALQPHGMRFFAAHPHANQQALSQTDFRGDCCVVFGNEGQGLTPAVLATCDAAVAIPMPPTVDSLNVASASAVFLYETQRQRQNQSA